MGNGNAMGGYIPGVEGRSKEAGEVGKCRGPFAEPLAIYQREGRGKASWACRGHLALDRVIAAAWGNGTPVPNPSNRREARGAAMSSMSSLGSLPTTDF